MVFVIWWGVADVIYVLYTRARSHPFLLLDISDILATFGASGYIAKPVEERALIQEVRKWTSREAGVEK
jgi:hypothetical protein